MTRAEKIVTLLSVFLMGSIFGFWGATQFFDVVTLPENKAVVTTIGLEIPQCDKELWERIKDGCE